MRSYWECLQILRDLGFPTAQHMSRCDDIDEVLKKIEAFAHQRGALAYQTDAWW